MNPDRGDLSGWPLEPDSGQPLDPRRIDAERRQRPDQSLLQVSAVALDVLAVPCQVEDRIADELPRPVVGRLAAAVGLDDLDAGALRHMHLAGLGASPQRDHGRVLQQHHRVQQLTARDRAGQRALQVPRLEIGHQPLGLKQVCGPAHASQG